MNADERFVILQNPRGIVDLDTGQFAPFGGADNAEIDHACSMMIQHGPRGFFFYDNVPGSGLDISESVEES